MLSCDTMAFTAKKYDGNLNVLAKNSDRPLGEAQPLIFFKGGEHKPGETVKCTHLTIPQAEKTFDIIGSKPYWIWGFEMGANEKGLFIGNEAQGSKCEGEKVEGLLGMDALRLALERGENARKAIEVIAELLKQYGQNANANVRYDRRYENTYILVDPEEVWVMETAGREWAAKKIDDFCAVSNCYTIETEWDLCSDGMEEYARSRRFVGPNEPMNFAKAYTLPASRQTNAVSRFRRMNKLIGEINGAVSNSDIKRIFRDHFEGEIIEPRFGAADATFATICMHAQTRDSAQTAASMIFKRDAVLGNVMLYAPSMPCCSVFIPVYWTGKTPEAMAEGGRYFSETSLWWSVEKMAAAIGADEERFAADVRKAFDGLEKTFEEKTAAAEEKAKLLMGENRKEEAFDLLAQLTEECTAELKTLADGFSEKICETLKKEGGFYGQRKEFLEDYCIWANMPMV